MIRYFGQSILHDKITLDDAEKRQSNLTNNISDFNSTVRSKAKADKKSTFEIINGLHDGRELVLNGFNTRIIVLVYFH